MIRHVVLAALLVLAMPAAVAQAAVETVVIAKDRYTDIDTRSTLELLRELRSPNADIRAHAVEKALKSPESFAPPVFYLTANLLLDSDRPKEALFWFYVGHMRAVNDATILTDRTAASGVDVLMTEHGGRLLQYAQAHPDLWLQQASLAIDWDRSHPSRYDRRWLALHGMQAMQSALGGSDGDSAQRKEITVPADTWNGIAERNRAKMLEIVKEVSAAARQSAPPPAPDSQKP